MNWLQFAATIFMAIWAIWTTILVSCLYCQVEELQREVFRLRFRCDVGFGEEDEEPDGGETV